jgi:hypothetical protein
MMNSTTTFGPVAAIGLLGAFAAGAGAQQLPAAIAPAVVADWRVTSRDALFQRRSAAIGPQELGEPTSPAGCFLAEWSFGLAGEVLGGGVTGVVTDSPGLPLVAAAAGTVAGMTLGSYAGRCRRFSIVGSLLGAGLSVFLGATAGSAFARDRSESDAGALAMAYLLMVPLAFIGNAAASMVNPRDDH